MYIKKIFTTFCLFILYYDSKFSADFFASDTIVLHGGFSSAFYEFEDNKCGIRLVITSVAC
jgi:hypothetical protein